jgi:ABC-type Fe3+-siderophore transport system permease subunit
MRLAAGYAVLLGALVLLAGASLTLGSGSLTDPHLRSTLLSLRASRLGCAILVGAALAVAGVVVQGLFRNPLADASLLGTSSGAALGGKIGLVLTELVLGWRGVHGIPPDVVLPIGCMAGALVSLTLLVALARGSSDVLSLVLTGFLLSSLFLALGGLITSMAQDRWELGRAVVSFSLGDLTGAGPSHVALAAPLVAVGVVASWFWAGPLDLLLSGDEEATSLGVNVQQVRICCVLWVATLTAGAVAIGGNIGFVGLLVPHALRPLLGVSHRRLVPVAALGGAVFVGACDLIVRVLPTRGVVPLGVVTSLLGAPAFLALLVRGHRRGSYV